MLVSLLLSILLLEEHAPKTGNKPGVTKGKQWIRLNKNVELLDTPGFSGPSLKMRQWECALPILVLSRTIY